MSETERLERLVNRLQSVIGLMAVRISELEKVVQENWQDGVRDYEDVLNRLRLAEQHSVME
jgi:hypothetical protein